MKKVLLHIVFLFIVAQGWCQGNESFVYKYLRDANGQEFKVVYFPATKSYYPCGGDISQKKKLAAGESILDKDCDCNIKPNPEPLTLSTPYGNIQFEFDSSVLRTSSYPMLDALSASLKNGKKAIFINGYASSEGTIDHNLELSKDRAHSVYVYLISSGVSVNLLKMKGYGATKPVADNSTEDGRVQNRRVEFSDH